MSKGQRPTLSGVLAAAIAAVAGGAVLLDGPGLVSSAQAQTAEEKKRRGEQERQKPPPSKPQIQPRATPPQPRVTQPPPQVPQQRRLPPPQVQQQQQQQQQQRRLPPPEQSVKPFERERPPSRPTQQYQPPPAAKPTPKPADASPPELKKREGIQRFQPSPGQPGAKPPYESGPTQPLTVTPRPQPGPSGPQVAPRRFDDVKRFRVERIEKGGSRKVIQEPDLVIVKEHNRTVVRRDETVRFLRRPGARSDRRPDGTVETFYIGRNGVRVVTVVDANGRLLRRYRRDRDGRERNIIDNRRFYGGLALGIGLGIVALNLPPPRISIPYDEYIVDYDGASDDDLYETLIAPPIEDLDRPYSLEEIRDNYELRARVRSIDIDTIEFESGAWEVSPDQYDKLERIARAILRVLESNPEAVFLIAGYTDAVGSEDDNASLSDRRVASVADVLTEQFDVPAENLVTQGYGEQYLKIDTQGPEPRNRRVSVQNVTGLMAER